MTDQELKAIEDRANAATPGPWRTGVEGRPGYLQNFVRPEGELIDSVCHTSERKVHDEVACCQVSNSPNFRSDAAFIAHAREDVPKLIAEIRRLKGER